MQTAVSAVLCPRAWQDYARTRSDRYVSAEQTISVRPAGSIPLTAIGLAVLSLPIAWLLATRQAPASKTV
jgi:hypothetical protein